MPIFSNLLHFLLNKVMVCTSAFGIGIDQSDVDKVIRVGVPPSIEQLVQEFGRTGRDGRACEGIIFFHDSDHDLQHAAFWCKDISMSVQNNNWRFSLIFSGAGGLIYFKSGAVHV